MKSTFFAPAYWIATVWPPLLSTVVCMTVLTIGAGAGELAVAGAKLTFPVGLAVDQDLDRAGEFGRGFAAVQVAEPEKVITAELMPALVANEVNAVGM